MRSTASSANLPAVKGADASPARTPPPPPQNRRSGLARRFSAFLAVALVAVGVALVRDTPPASAQTNTNVIWSATLTVADDVNGAGTRGCHRFASGSGLCTAALTSTTFTHAGSSFTVGGVYGDPTRARKPFHFEMDSNFGNYILD